MKEGQRCLLLTPRALRKKGRTPRTANHPEVMTTTPKRPHVPKQCANRIDHAGHKTSACVCVCVCACCGSSFVSLAVIVCPSMYVICLCMLSEPAMIESMLRPTLPQISLQAKQRGTKGGAALAGEVVVVVVVVDLQETQTKRLVIMPNES